MEHSTSSSEAGGLLGPGLRDFIAGAVAGAFAITVSQPLDTVRVRIQQACASGGVPSTLTVLSSMVRKEGLLSPWKGLTYPLLFASVQSAILFQAYGWTLRQLASPDPDAPEQQQQQQQQQSSQAVNLEALSAAAGSVGSSAASGGSGVGGSGAPVALHQTRHSSQPHQHQHHQQQQHQPHPHSNQVHQLHLHHHHHAVSQRMRETEVHGPSSVTGRVFSLVASSLGLEAAGLRGSGELQGRDGDRPSSSRRRDTDTVGSAGGGSRGLGEVPAGAGAGQHGSGVLREDEVERPQPIPTPWHGFVAGGVAGMAQVFLWSPVELLKLRAQLQTASPGSAGYRNPAALAAQVLRQDGVAGLYRGFTLTVVRDVPSYAMYFWLYHDIAAALNPGIHPEQAPPATQVLAGGLAGVLAWLPIYPLDVIKTRVQAVSSAASTKTWWQHTKELRSERALYRGCLPTLVRAFVMDGASFLGYTTTLRLLAGAGAGAGGGGSSSSSSSSSNSST